MFSPRTTRICLGLTLRWLCSALTNINLDARPVKQQQRRFRPEIMEAIQSEVKKLIDSDFIREEQCPDWVANIVPVTKKNGKIWVCIDFRDINEACPKDEFPLPITDVMIDNTCGFERMSFMDGFYEYNQIKMYPDDEMLAQRPITLVLMMINSCSYSTNDLVFI